MTFCAKMSLYELCLPDPDIPYWWPGDDMGSGTPEEE